MIPLAAVFITARQLGNARGWKDFLGDGSHAVAKRPANSPNVVNRISAFMEEPLKTAIKTTTQFIEPVMIGMMGVLIGGVAIAMLMPILTISKVMANG